MFPVEENLKRRIKKHYELFDPEEKIYLDGPAKDIIEPAFLEYQKKILNFIKKKNENIEDIENKTIDSSSQKLEELEIFEEEKDETEEKFLDIEILSTIEKKVNEIILYFNLEFFRKDEEKEKLKDLIVQDMLDRYINFSLTNKMKETIIKVVKDNVSHEFREYNLKKKIRIKNLFLELKDNLYNELEKIILNHKKNRSKVINQYQLENFLKYLLEYIDNKYIKKLKKDKKLNNEDYLLIKELMEKFIVKKYNTEIHII